MNKYDKMIYDYYLDQKSTKNSKEDLYEVLDYFYKGEKSGDLVETVSEISRVSMLASACRGNILRSIEQADLLLTSVKKGDDPSQDKDSNHDMKNKQIIQSSLCGDDYLEAQKNLQDKQNAIDSVIMTTAAGKYSDKDPATSLSKDDIKDREAISALMEKDNIKKIMMCFGIISAHLNKVSRERVFPDPTNKSEVTIGNDLKSLCSGELVNLAIPTLQDLFNYRYTQKALQQYKRERVQPAGKGAVAIMIDKSESMKLIMSFAGMQISRLSLAIAVTLAMVKHLNESGREFKVYTFNNICSKVADSKDFKMVSFTRYLLSKLDTVGGTSIQYSLDHILKDTDTDFDICCITDAEDYVNPEWVQVKGERKLSMCFVSNQTRYIEPMKAISDTFILASSENGVVEFAEQIL